MTDITLIQTPSRDAYSALVARREALHGAAARSIAAHDLEAECAEFHWESRLGERHLGRYEQAFDDEETPDERERIAIIGMLEGRWFVAICIVDGEGAVHDIYRLSEAPNAAEAWRRYARMR